MKARVIRIALLAAVILSVGGCIPATWTTRPQISGRVVSARRQPIANVTVTITESRHHGVYSSRTPLQLVTDRDGRFFSAERVQWALVPLLPLDGMGSVYTAPARADGRQSTAVRFGGAISNPHFLGLGNKYPDIELHDLVLFDPPTATTTSEKH